MAKSTESTPASADPDLHAGSREVHPATGPRPSQSSQRRRAPVGLPERDRGERRGSRRNQTAPRNDLAGRRINLQELTAALSQPRLTEMPYSAKDLVDDLQQKLASAHPEEGAARAMGDRRKRREPEYRSAIIAARPPGTVRECVPSRARRRPHLDLGRVRTAVCLYPFRTENGTSSARPKTGDANRFAPWARVITALDFIGPAPSSKRTAGNSTLIMTRLHLPGHAGDPASRAGFCLTRGSDVQFFRE
jgi:hypothetical protein